MNQQTPSVPEPASPPAKATQPPWSLGDIVICVVGGVVSGFVLSVLLWLPFAAFNVKPPNSVIYLVGGSSVYLMVGVFVWFLLVRRRKVSLEALGFRPSAPATLLLMIPATFVLLLINGIVAALTGLLINEVPDAQDQLAVGNEGMSATDLICILVVVAVIGPVIEELVFRGLLQQSLRASHGFGTALFVSSLAFSITHFIPALLGVLFVMGLIYGWIAERFKSLYPAILLHSLNNAVSTLLVFIALS